MLRYGGWGGHWGGGWVGAVARAAARAKSGAEAGAEVAIDVDAGARAAAMARTRALPITVYPSVTLCALLQVSLPSDIYCRAFRQVEYAYKVIGVWFQIGSVPDVPHHLPRWEGTKAWHGGGGFRGPGFGKRCGVEEDADGGIDATYQVQTTAMDWV